MPDAVSLDRLVLDHLPGALRFATRLAGDPDTAEELLQEALLRAVRRWATFRGESEFRTWLFRIIINVFRDHLRRSRGPLQAIENLSAQTIDRTGVEPAEAARQMELQQLVAREVSRLPPRQREVLTLSVFEGFSVPEVGAMVGISQANVHSTLSAARLRLKSRLAPYLGSVEK